MSVNVRVQSFISFLRVFPPTPPTFLLLISWSLVTPTPGSLCLSSRCDHPETSGRLYPDIIRLLFFQTHRFVGVLVRELHESENMDPWPRGIIVIDIFSEDGEVKFLFLLL
jgi:hypothetical protein